MLPLTSQPARWRYQQEQDQKWPSSPGPSCRAGSSSPIYCKSAWLPGKTSRALRAGLCPWPRRQQQLAPAVSQPASGIRQVPGTGTHVAASTWAGPVSTAGRRRSGATRVRACAGSNIFPQLMCDAGTRAPAAASASGSWSSPARSTSAENCIAAAEKCKSGASGCRRWRPSCPNAPVSLEVQGLSTRARAALIGQPSCALDAKS